MSDEDWPDLETALMNWLQETVVLPDGGVLRTGTSLAFNEGESYIRVAVLDCPDDGLTQHATVEIDTFSPSRNLSYNLGRQVRRLLQTARRIDGVLVDRLLTVSGPKRVPWDNSNTRRHLARYRISTRRQEGAP